MTLKGPALERCWVCLLLRRPRPHVHEGQCRSFFNQLPPSTVFSLPPVTANTLRLQTQGPAKHTSKVTSPHHMELNKDPFWPCILGKKKILTLEITLNLLQTLLVDAPLVHTACLLCKPTASHFCLIPLADPTGACVP